MKLAMTDGIGMSEVAWWLLISTKTLANGVINLMRDVLLHEEPMYCDETTFQGLKEKGRNS